MESYVRIGGRGLKNLTQLPVHGGRGVKNCQSHPYIINEWPLNRQIHTSFISSTARSGLPTLPISQKYLPVGLTFLIVIFISPTKSRSAPLSLPFPLSHQDSFWDTFFIKSCYMSSPSESIQNDGYYISACCSLLVFHV